MLRPQVFAMQEGEVQIGLICSEKQAIDATLQSLAAEDNRFCPIADKYWNARGGSSSDGGTFIFTVKDSGKGDGNRELTCTNKFGAPVVIADKDQQSVITVEDLSPNKVDADLKKRIISETRNSDSTGLKEFCRKNIADWDFAALEFFCRELAGMLR